MALWDVAIEHDPPDPPEALNYHEPAIMLRAMAVECLLKARAAEQRMVIAKDGEYVLGIPGVRDHDLVGLAKAVNFVLSPQEERVLRRLSRWITAGRYPIQRRWSDQERVRPDGMLELLTVVWHPAWDEACDDVVARLTNPTDLDGV